MKRLLLLFCLFLPVSVAIAQDTTTYNFSGAVRSSLDTSALSGAHVINLISLEGTVTDEDGRFSLPVRIGDRVLVSFLGFEIDTIKINEERVGEVQNLIELIETSYLLSIFDILSIGTFEEFERAFLALELPDEKLNFTMPKPGAYQKLPENQAFTIAIPFDLSYFSKKSRDYRRYQALYEQDQKEQLVNVRYNPKVIEQVVGMSKREEAKELMEYCDFSEYFIRNSTDYDLYVAIIQCHRAYQSKKSKELKAE